jgi:hypothetical protein
MHHYFLFMCVLICFHIYFEFSVAQLAVFYWYSFVCNKLVLISSSLPCVRFNLPSESSIMLKITSSLTVSLFQLKWTFHMIFFCNHFNECFSYQSSLNVITIISVFWEIWGYPKTSGFNCNTSRRYWIWWLYIQLKVRHINSWSHNLCWKSNTSRRWI